MLFYEKLKNLRKLNGFTQEELAEKLNVSRQAITKWESGEGIPDIENLKQISNLFNTTIDELVKDHTVVIVAHRLSTIVDADKINIIDKGILLDSGTHEELLERNSVYQGLYKTEDSNS